MKLQRPDHPQHQPRKKSSKLYPLIALTILLTIPLYYISMRESSSNQLPDPTSPLSEHPPIVPQTPPISDIQTVKKATEDKSDDDDLLPPEIADMANDDGPLPIRSEPAEKDFATATKQRRPRRKRERGGRRKRTTRDENRRKQTTSENRRKQTTSENNSNDQNEDEESRLLLPTEGVKRWETARSRVLDEGKCDLFTGDWFPNPEGPYYTNETCGAIQEHQNCLKFGRPDRGFLRWRWKPDGCEMPVFDPDRFLEVVRGKSIAFVGDSVARNHMQSLICLLSRVEDPVDLSGPVDQNKRYEYREHDFNISMFWAPYLVRTEKTDPDDEKRPFKLYLDEFDEKWTAKIAPFDYVIISAGHWFFRPTYFYVGGRLSGCLYCPEPEVTHYTTSYFSYRRAFRTAFRAINAAGFRGVAFLRTFAPSHFEGAAWDRGGDCSRTGPYGRNDVVLEDYSLEMYMIQLEELRIAQRGGGGKFRLFDATGAMLLRPDGHPSKYGHWQGVNQSFANDCVHWCLPGPIDSWNDFLQELLSRESMDGRK